MSFSIIGDGKNSQPSSSEGKNTPSSAKKSIFSFGGRKTIVATPKPQNALTKEEIQSKPLEIFNNVSSPQPPTPRKLSGSNLTPPSLNNSLTSCKVEEIAQQLQEFILVFVKAGQQAQVEADSLELNDTKPRQDFVKQRIYDAVQKSWEETSSAMEQLLQEGKQRPRSISDYQIKEWEKLQEALQPESKSKQQKTFKTCLAVATECMKELIIDLENLFQASNKEKFKILASEEKFATALNYLENLQILAALCKRATNQTLLHKKDSLQSPIENYLYYKLTKRLQHCEQVEKEQKEAKNTLVAKSLNEFGAMLEKKIGDIKRSYANHEMYSASISKIVNNTIRCLTSKPINTFRADIRRAIMGNFLNLKTDKEVSVPTLYHLEFKEESHQEAPAQLKEVLKGLLKFFMYNVKLDPDDLECQDILKEMDKQENDCSKQESIDEMFGRIEKIFDKLNQKQDEELLKLEQSQLKEEPLNQNKTALVYSGVLKILPLLRAFNQAILLEIHARIFTLHQGLASQESFTKLVQEFKGVKPDNITKKILFDFKEDKVTITVERLGHLDGYPKCLIKSVMVMSASTSDMGNWTINPSVIIDKPIEPPDEKFSSKHQELLQTLNIMGVPFSNLQISL